MIIQHYNIHNKNNKTKMKYIWIDFHKNKWREIVKEWYFVDEKVIKDLLKWQNFSLIKIYKKLYGR